MAARLKGIDIFTTGNFQAGTANVFWNISRRTGLIVFICDVAKGSVSVLIADLLGIPPYLLVIAGAAAVLGHWKSLFTGFKGGDQCSKESLECHVMPPKPELLSDECVIGPKSSSQSVPDLIQNAHSTIHDNLPLLHQDNAVRHLLQRVQNVGR